MTVFHPQTTLDGSSVHRNWSIEPIALFLCRILVQKISMIYGYARISTDGQSVTAQVAALRKHGAGKVFREVASGAKADRPQLRRLLPRSAPAMW
jgi:hypothetical protein